MKNKTMLAKLTVVLLILTLGIFLFPHNQIRSPGDIGMYEGYCYTSEFSEIMTGRNGDKKQDHYLTVHFVQTSGPLETQIQILAKEPKQEGYTLVETFPAELGKGRVTVIPAGQDFQVMAKATECQQGTAAFQVILAKGDVK